MRHIRAHSTDTDVHRPQTGGPTYPTQHRQETHRSHTAQRRGSTDPTQHKDMPRHIVTCGFTPPTQNTYTYVQTCIHTFPGLHVHLPCSRFLHARRLLAGPPCPPHSHCLGLSRRILHTLTNLDPQQPKSPALGHIPTLLCVGALTSTL